ncbi:hypothetical protein ACJX0J_032325 [Zea mays]
MNGKEDELQVSKVNNIAHIGHYNAGHAKSITAFCVRIRFLSIRLGCFRLVEIYSSIYRVNVALLRGTSIIMLSLFASLISLMGSLVSYLSVDVGSGSSEDFVNIQSGRACIKKNTGYICHYISGTG